MSLDQERKMLCEIAQIRKDNGSMPRECKYAQDRETIISVFVSTLLVEKDQCKRGAVFTNAAWKAPVIRGIRKQDKLLEQTAQRIAWELFPEQFSNETRDLVLGIENDPFYDEEAVDTLSDAERMAIGVQKAAAEKKYRNLLRNIRTCHRFNVTDKNKGTKVPSESPEGE